MFSTSTLLSYWALVASLSAATMLERHVASGAQGSSMPRSSAASLVPALLLLIAWPAAGQEGGVDSPAPPSLDHLLHGVTRAVEVVGIAVIVLGAIAASIYLVWQLIR